MSQSGFIVGALLAAFVLYLAAKGRLSVYTGVLWGGSASGSGTGGGGSGSALAGVASLASTAAQLFALAP